MSHFSQMKQHPNKSNRQRRFQQKRRHILRQRSIYLAYRMVEDDMIPEFQFHRYHKRKAMNCGTPRCIFCGNPRYIWNQKTLQERKHEQFSIDIEYETE